MHLPVWFAGRDCFDRNAWCMQVLRGLQQAGLSDHSGCNVICIQVLQIFDSSDCNARCMQVLQGLQGEVMLGGAACLARQGFLDTAQDLLTQHRAAVGRSHLRSLQAQLRLRIAQVSNGCYLAREYVGC